MTDDPTLIAASEQVIDFLTTYESTPGNRLTQLADLFDALGLSMSSDVDNDFLHAVLMSLKEAGQIEAVEHAEGPVEYVLRDA
jgi:hypothetical protein